VFHLVGDLFEVKKNVEFLCVLCIIEFIEDICLKLDSGNSF